MPARVPALVFLSSLILSLAAPAQEGPPAPVAARVTSLFDGRTLTGWEGDLRLWRVEDGAIVGGSLTETLKQNEFLATTRRFTNFVFRARFKLTGTGFVNSGVQMRSERVPGSSEMAGYQCDIGDPNWWGSLYDESRRNRVLAWSDLARIEPTLHRNDWNDYVIRADGRRITTWINGVLGVDYTEPDPDIIDSGRIGFQVHGGGAAQASFKDITVEELPARPKVQGAVQPAAPPHASPLSPEEQQATFGLPPGYVAELVAAEPDGGKFVAIQFDHAGRLWAMTALEYPLDANEAGAEAKALFERGGRDRVLVFDTPTAPGRQKARTFADGLVMPLGVLPYRNGAYVQYGNDIRFYTDTNGDGRADGFTNVLSGFGIEDSHLFPHQFTRAPGGWFWLAQGAFNYSQVRTSGGDVTAFNKTKMARWSPDGRRFETIGWGPCNIWGLVLDRHGEAFIQEANDQGWPVMPFLEGGSYPLCGDDVPRPYAPPFPKTGEKEMGGTGLSGLAFSEGADSFPSDWRDVFFINNPITRKVQAVRVHRGLGGTDRTGNDFGNGWQLEHLPDFVHSSDPWFRPVAMCFGPDGCLYVVDWYNQIISHNEVPRKHPERDKTRGRIWRFRHESQPHRIQVPNLYRVPDADLLTHLKAVDTWEVNAAWLEIVDRQAVSLAPALAAWMLDRSQPTDLRIRALWCLEGLHRLEAEPIAQLATASHRSLRREALRAGSGLPATTLSPERAFMLARTALSDPDRLVRQEGIRWLAQLLPRPTPPGMPADAVADELIQSALRPPSTGGEKYGPYFRAFETYLVRKALEQSPASLEAWFASHQGTTSEGAALAALTQGGMPGARRLAGILPGLDRPPSGEELILLASHAGDSGIQPLLASALTNATALRLLYDQRSSLRDPATVSPALTAAIRSLVSHDPSPAHEELMVRLAAGFRLSGLEPELITAASRPGAKPAAQLAALRALRESGSTRVDVLRRFALSGDDAVRREAVTALAAARSDEVVPSLLEIWATLTPSLRKVAVDGLTRSPASARQLVAAITAGTIAREELDGYALDKLSVVLPEDPTIRQLQGELQSMLRPVLRLGGGDEDVVRTALTLEGPFTVETWVKLDPGINNQDSLLGGPDQLDANFYDGRFRLWLGGGVHDIVVASKPTFQDSWTHVAFTRDASGHFRIYLNGELDATSAGTSDRRFEKLDIAHSNVPGGTAGELAHFRVWNVCRSADDIRATANVDPPANTPGLVFRSEGESWGELGRTARVERTSDLPPVLTEAEARALDARFDRFRKLASQHGDPVRGQQNFAALCGTCHTVKGTGGKIGPALDGAGAHGAEALLRNILTPNAAMEAGYRRYRIETRDGDLLEGLLAAQDAESVTLRQPGSEDQRFARTDLRRSGFIRGSVMPEGLLESLDDDRARDLLSYVLTLR